MNRETINKKYEPVRLITVYKTRGEYSNDYYLESRDIISHNGKPQFGAPVPLSDQVMKEIGKSYIAKNSVEMEHDQMIGEHLIHVSNRIGNVVLVWWHPAMRKVLNFDQHLKIKSAEVNIPAMLYLLQNTSLYIFALMDDTRPGLQTKLYQAPFYNIYSDARVCMGSAPISKIRAKTFEQEAERFERAFFMAEQTGGMSESHCKTPLGPLWRSLIGTKKIFPAKKELIQHPKFKTLGTLLNRFIDNQNDED